MAEQGDTERHAGRGNGQESCPAPGSVRAWPAFEGVDIAGIAQCLGCPSVRVRDHDALEAALDEVMPGLAARGEPLLLEVALAA